MWADAEILDRMQKGWSSTPETPCGDGSADRNTKAVRARLPYLCREHVISSICDAGAGDLYWVRKLLEHLPPYRGFDLVPRHPEVQQLDITREALPQCDLIVCRYVLIHLDLDRVIKALRLFKQSGKYFLATTYPSERNAFRKHLDFNQWNLEHPPFNLGKPLELIAECRPGSYMGLWRLG